MERGAAGCWIYRGEKVARWHGARHAGDGRRGAGVLPYGEEDKGRMMLGCFGWAKKERKRGKVAGLGPVLGFSGFCNFPFFLF